MSNIATVNSPSLLSNNKVSALDGDLPLNCDEQGYFNDIGDETKFDIVVDKVLPVPEEFQKVVSSTNFTTELVRELTNVSIEAVEDDFILEVTVTRLILPDYDEVMEDGTYWVPGDPFSMPLTNNIHRTRHYVGRDYDPYSLSRSSSSSSSNSTNSTEITPPEGETDDVNEEQRTYSERLEDIQVALAQIPVLEPAPSAASSDYPIDLPHIVPFPSFTLPPLTKYPLSREQPPQHIATQQEIFPISHSGLSIDDFEIIKIIGKGAEGHVYQVERKGTKIKYALKAVLDIYKEDGTEKKEGQVGWLRDEQGIMKSLGDEKVFVRLDASWNDTKNFYFLSPLYATDLEIEIKRIGHIPKGRCQFYFAQLTIAINALHTRGIIHRDIKPSNLMLEFDGNLVVGDFGLSDDFGVEPTIEQRTHQPYYPYWVSDDVTEDMPHRPIETLPYILNGYCGSPPHMAPEIWLRQPYSFPVDWWSAATGLYNMVTGRYPFWVGRNDLGEKLADKVTKGPLQFFPFDMADDDTKDFLYKMLMKKPEERLPIQEIESHAFFRGIDWDAMRRREVIPPFVPAGENYVIHDPVEPFIRGDSYGEGENPCPDFEYVSSALEAAGVYLSSSKSKSSMFAPEIEQLMEKEVSETSHKHRILKLWRRFFKPSKQLNLSIRTPDIFSPVYREDPSAPSTPYYSMASYDPYHVEESPMPSPAAQPMQSAEQALHPLKRMRTRVKHAFIRHARPLPPSSPRFELD